MSAGTVADIVKFFKGFTVDEEFMDSPRDFEIYTPAYTYADIVDKLTRDQIFAYYRRK